MRITRTTLLLYNLIVVIILITIGFATQTYGELTPTLLLLPIAIYFSISFLAPFNVFAALEKDKKFLNLVTILKVYSFIIIAFMVLASLVHSTNLLESSLTIVFLPLLAWFWLDILRNRSAPKPQPIKLPPAAPTKLKTTKKSKTATEKPVEVLEELKTPTPTESFLSRMLNSDEAPDPNIQDNKKRQFLKILGGGGVSLFLTMFVFKQNASAAFFGSGGGPGVVALKDSAGTKIDPAEKQPTDGYNITEIDDLPPTSYYGFVHKNGNWYIAKEDNSGTYRYAKGSSSFSTNWTNRATLTYGYFNTVFG
jgi:hypothetical protein